MPVTYLFAGLAVADFGTALPWYERLLGRPPDRFPHESEAVWQLTETGLIYLVGDAGRAGHGLLTLIVDDLDSHLDHLTQRGLLVGPVELVGDSGRRATIDDLEGNRITFAQVHASHAG